MLSFLLFKIINFVDFQLKKELKNKQRRYLIKVVMKKKIILFNLFQWMLIVANSK